MITPWKAIYTHIKYEICNFSQNFPLFTEKPSGKYELKEQYDIWHIIIDKTWGPAFITKFIP